MFTKRAIVTNTEAADGTAGESPLLRVWRNRSLFGAVFLGVMILTVIALVVLPVRYLATGSVIVAEQEPSNSNASAAWAQKIGDPADVESQLLIARSPRVMRLAMQQPGVTEAAIEECQSRSSSSTCEKMRTDTAALIDYVSGNFAIGAVGRSRVINISYTSSIPEVAQKMANSLTNAFLDEQRTSGASSREVAASYLWKEAKQLDAELRDADAKIQAFRRNKGLMRGSLAPISSERLSSISQQLSTAETARADALARLQEIKANQARAVDSPSVLSNRSIADLKQQLTVVTAQLASQANVLGPRHPSLRALEQEQSAIKERMATEVASIAASAQKAFDANDSLVNALRKQMDAVKAEVGSATSDEASIESMVRSTEIKRQQYADLYKRASELETERRVLIGNTRLVSLAELPTKPFFPKKIPFLAAGGTLGLLLAFVAAFFGDRVNLAGLSRLRTATIRPVRAAAPAAEAAPVAVAAPVAPAPVQTTAPVAPRSGPPPTALSSELAVVTGAPILARLPTVKRDPSESPIGAILTAQSGASLARALPLALQDRHYQDALRDLATGLLASNDARTRRKILVASPTTAEGKTFLTLTLAQYLATAGRSVLVIECDFGAPKFETALGLRSNLGLQGILRGDITAREAVVRTATPNLDVIPAGPFSASAELLMRKPLGDLLLWSQIYDVVLIDAPSPGIQTDLGVLARQVDGVLLCMRSGRSSIGQAVATSSAIRVAGGSVFGIAVTMMPDANTPRGTDRVSNDAYAGAT
ncbi:GumC family protein [Tardiphaga robiniae]|uniref:Lipopolysaccharide biosynthesis protein n=1 Tax=Tardiphaga robiniae TaxID=943830 RepID=A0A161SP35_9BRAD|nr:polysaccharide biosynthesis tyrosine autokinase [Tardiphaga robiniae]KZD22472.1 lipopolysaccharide biosynthesis protein [Tardiphaga robiniae]